MNTERQIGSASRSDSALPPMSELLERSGFRLRGRNRAECIHCTGHDTGTVAFTDEVAFCHRCKRTMNTVMLAKELGLFRADPESRRKRREEMLQLAEYKKTIKRFEEWRDGHIKRLSAELRALSRTALLAKDVLNRYPDCDAAWNALARFCHREGELHRLLDWLVCAKASVWLDEDSTILGVFDAWREHVDEKR